VRPPRHITAVIVALVVVLGSSTLAGCTAARDGLGTRASLCFRFLPQAHDAVPKSAVFSGVRSLPGDDLVMAIKASPADKRLPPDALVDAAHQMTCLVAFRGRFTVAGVTKGWAPKPGPYRGAVVAVAQDDGKIIVTVLFATVPRSIDFLHQAAFVT
jgi:hypothetical protein